MFDLQTDSNFNIPLAALRSSGDEGKWFAIHTVARHEKRVVEQLRQHGVCTFLPLVEQIRDWSDRQARVEVPLFSCYAFVRIAQRTDQRSKIVRTPGVLGFVGSEKIGTPIADEEIENLQVAIQEKTLLAAHPFLTAGNRVRIRGGSLNGLEGILVGRTGNRSVIVSLELLQRSISIRVEGYRIEAA